MQKPTGNFKRVVEPSMVAAQERNNRIATTEYKWERIHEALKSVDKQKWNTQLCGSSVILTNQKKTKTIKLTVANEVFVEQKLGHLQYKSSKDKFISIEQATAKVLELI